MGRGKVEEEEFSESSIESRSKADIKKLNY